MRAAILGIALAATVLIGVVIMRGGTSNRAPAQVENKKPDGSVTVTRRHSPEVVLAIRPGAAPPAAPATAAWKASPLMEQYLSKRDRKALFDRLARLPSPTAEERYVLAEIANDCRGGPPPEEARRNFEAVRAVNLKGVSEKDPTRAKRSAAFDALFLPRFGLCTGFAKGETTRDTVRSLMLRAAEAGDVRAQVRLVEIDMWLPLLDRETGGVRVLDPKVDAPRMTDAQFATLKDAVRSGDPTVIAVAGRILSNTMSNVQINVGPDERAVDLRAFYDAWNLVACDAGASCGGDHEAVLFGCLTFGNCDARDFREHLFFYDNSPVQSQRVAEYQSQITRAIRSGDWSWFQFTTGPTPSGPMFMRPPP